MRSLVLCDDRWHPAATARAGLAPLVAQGFAFDWVEDAEQWSAQLMDRYPVVLLTKANNISSSDERPWMTEEIGAAFVAYVRRGGGLLVIHSGSAGYAEARALRGLLGGVFVSHPPQCPVTVAPSAGHALAAGSAPFTLVDEHYFMALDDEGADLFLTTTSEHGTQPAGWTRREGDGRVCLLTPGHNLPVWLDPSYQMIIGHGLRWCGGGV